MSEQLLNQILEVLNRLDDRVNNIDARMNNLEADVKSIKADTADIPLIRRAVLETNEVVRQMENTQKSFERKATSELYTHDHSIDILNRRQLKLEAEVEHMKHS